MMTNNELLYSMNTMRVLLHTYFYTPEVLLEIQEAFKSSCHISSLSYNENTKSFQIQFRKTMLKKVDDPTNSLEFYMLFNELMKKVYATHEHCIRLIFNNDPLASYEGLINNIAMIYNLMRISSNSIILYL